MTTHTAKYRYEIRWIDGDIGIIDTVSGNEVWTFAAGDMERAQIQAAKLEKQNNARIARNAASRARHAAYTSCGMKRTPYGYE